LWSNITILIENNKFTIKYNYEDLLGTKYSSYDRHIIWKYEYLNVPLEKLSKKDRIMIEDYYKEIDNKEIKIKEYSEGMYNNRTHNIIEYNKEQIQSINEQIEKEESIQNDRKIKPDKYELHKIKSKQEKQQEKNENAENEIKVNKNQILNFVE